MFTQNEASRANLNVDKRIFELPPFMHRVYACCFFRHLAIFVWCWPLLLVL